MQPLLVNGIFRAIENNLVGLVEFVPTLLGTALSIYLGLYLGRTLQPRVTRAGQRVGLDETVRETPFGALFPDGSDAVSRTLAAIAKYFVVVIAVFAAIEWFALRTTMTSSFFVTTWARDVFGYVPTVVMGVLALFVGFYLANWAADQVRESPVASRLGASPLIASATKFFLYFIVLVIGLDTMGVDVTILHTFARAFAYATGLAAALAIGIAFGWGGKDYVAENIDDWLETTRDAATDSTAIASDD